MRNRMGSSTTVTILRMHLRSLRNAIRYETRMRVALGIGFVLSTLFGLWSASQLLPDLHEWQLQGEAVLDARLWSLCWFTWISMGSITVLSCVQKAMGDDEAMVLFLLPIPPATRFRALYGSFFIDNLWNWLLIEVGITGSVLLIALGWHALIWLVLLQLGVAVAVLCALLCSFLAIAYLIAGKRVKSRRIIACTIGILLVTLFVLRGKLTVLAAISLPRPEYASILFILLLFVGMGPLAKQAGKLYLTAFSITQNWNRSRKGRVLPGIGMLIRAFVRRRTLLGAMFVKMLLSQSRNFIAWGRLCIAMLLLLLFSPFHMIARQSGWPDILFVICFGAGLACVNVLEQATCAISGEANRLSLYLISPCELAEFLRAKLLLFLLPVLLTGWAVGLFLAWQLRLQAGQAAFSLTAITLIIAGTVALLVYGSVWDENLDMTVEGALQTMLQEEVPITPQRLWLLNLGVTFFILTILLSWKFAPVAALLLLTALDGAVLIGMWHIARAHLKRLLAQGNSLNR